MATVDLADGEAPVRLEVEFLAPADVKLKRNHPKLVEGPVCSSIRRAPRLRPSESVELEGGDDLLEPLVA